MGGYLIGGLSGLAFWVIAARLYTTEDVGLASAVIAAMGLLASLANLGLGHGLIRFLAHSGSKANGMLNSSFTISLLASLLASAIFLGGLSLWSTTLTFLRQEPMLVVAFVVFTMAFTLRVVGGDAFIARRRASLLLAMATISNLLRLPLIILLAGLSHSFGIFASWSIALWVGLIVGILVFLPRAQSGYRPRLGISREVKEIIGFSSGSYISNLLRTAPSLILPIMIINLLGAETTAYFYVAWMVGGTMNMVSETASLSLFAEGSFDETRLGLNVRRIVKMIVLLLLPTVILVVVFADKLLLVFGGSYSDSAAALLRVLAVSSLPMSVNTVYLYIKRVEKRLSMLITVTAFLAVSILTLSYVLLPRMGITGAGFAWLISQGVVALVITAGFVKKRFG